MIEREKVNKFINISLKVLFSALFVVIAFSVFYIEATKKPKAEVDQMIEDLRQNMILLKQGKLHGVEKNSWPPEMNKEYPDIDMLDKNGREFKLSDLKGYVVVLSYIDMSSPASQAQAGAVVAGAYGNTSTVYNHILPFSEVYRKNTLDEMKLPNDSVLEVQVLVYAPDGKQATVDDADKWAEHFGLGLEQGVVVAVPKKDLRGEETDKITNGYQLLDKTLVLRVDSAGLEPKHNLEMSLVPMLPKLAR